MSSPTYATIILDLTRQIDQLTQSFVFKGYHALSSALAKPLAALFVLFIVLTGYGLVRGLIKTPMQEFSKGLFRIGLIYMLAMNWGVFSGYFVKLFIDSAGELGASLMKATSFKTMGGGINEGLQSVLTEVIRVGAWTWDKASFKHWGPIFTAILIDFSGLVVIGLALFELIIAKLMLSICLCSAPLFFCFLLFDQTKSFFDRWLGTLVGFSLVLIMVSSVVGLSMHLIHWTIADHYATHAAHVTASDWVPVFIVAGLCVMAILEVTGIAKSIGGSCSSGNGSAMVGGFIGGAMGAGAAGKLFGQKTLGLAKTVMPSGMNPSKENAYPTGQENFSNIRNHMRSGQ